MYNYIAKPAEFQSMNLVLYVRVNHTVWYMKTHMHSTLQSRNINTYNNIYREGRVVTMKR